MLLLNHVIIVRNSAAQFTSVEFHVHAHRESFVAVFGSLVIYSIAQYTCVSTGKLRILVVFILVGHDLVCGPMLTLGL